MFKVLIFFLFLKDLLDVDEPQIKVEVDEPPNEPDLPEIVVGPDAAPEPLKSEGLIRSDHKTSK